MRPNDGKDRVRIWVDRGWMYPERRIVEGLYDKAVKSGDNDRAEHLLDALTSPNGEGR
jgi:hypothetical protein